jgi:hypothetical protein
VEYQAALAATATEVVAGKEFAPEAPRGGGGPYSAHLIFIDFDACIKRVGNKHRKLF